MRKNNIIDGQNSSRPIPKEALAEQVSFNDNSIKASFTKFSSPKGSGECQGYLVTPRDLAQTAPVVLVVHENRGLNPYIDWQQKVLLHSRLMLYTRWAATQATMMTAAQCNAVCNAQT